VRLRHRGRVPRRICDTHKRDASYVRYSHTRRVVYILTWQCAAGAWGDPTPRGGARAGPAPGTIYHSPYTCAAGGGCPGAAASARAAAAGGGAPPHVGSDAAGPRRRRSPPAPAPGSNPSTLNPETLRLSILHRKPPLRSLAIRPRPGASGEWRVESGEWMRDYSKTTFRVEFTFRVGFSSVGFRGSVCRGWNLVRRGLLLGRGRIARLRGGGFRCRIVSHRVSGFRV